MKTSGALPVWWFLQNNVRRVICLVLLFIALSELELRLCIGDWATGSISRPYVVR